MRSRAKEKEKEAKENIVKTIAKEVVVKADPIGTTPLGTQSAKEALTTMDVMKMIIGTHGVMIMTTGTTPTKTASMVITS